MVNKQLTLSIVIPVFNEEDYLGDCLDSIANQTQMPEEVIVVDNNCTDASVKIAQRYPFVTLLKEPHQHQAFAQKTGFNYASGDILGRIDADTVLPDNWVENVKKHFVDEPNLQALTGTPWPYDVFAKRACAAVFMFYHGLASFLARRQMIWGANAALRKATWDKIEPHVLQRSDIWEDYDLSLLIDNPQSIKLVDDLEVGTSFRTIHMPFMSQAEWQFRNIRTFYLRCSLPLTILLALTWGTMAVFYPLALLDEYVLKSVFGFREYRREVLEAPALID